MTEQYDVASKTSKKMAVFLMNRRSIFQAAGYVGWIALSFLSFTAEVPFVKGYMSCNCKILDIKSKLSSSLTTNNFMLKQS